MSNKRKTKQYIINLPFQLNVIKYFVVLFVIVSFANLASVYYFFYKFKNHGFAAGLSKQHVFFRFISEQETTMYFIMGGAILLSLFVLVIGGFILSHKVAGPLYRLTQHMKAYNGSEKELDAVTFRKGDYFPEIEKEFNTMVEKVKQHQ